MKRRSAFTLVELLVVIGIIAVLISILLPSLNKARSQAQLVTCSSQVRQIILAAVMYAGDNQGYLPNCQWQGNPATVATTPGKPGYVETSPAYCWRCASYSSGANGGDSIGANVGLMVITKYLSGSGTVPNSGASVSPIEWCPSSQAGSNINFMFNPWAAYHGYGTTNIRFDAWFNKLNNYGKVPTGAIAAVQGIGSTPSLTPAATTHVFPQVPLPLCMDNCDQTAATSITTATTGAMPHDTGKERAFNLGFADGHVATVKVRSQYFTRTGGTWGRDADMESALSKLANGTAEDVSSGYSWQNQEDYNPCFSQ